MVADSRRMAQRAVRPSAERIPPHNVEAEQSLLGAMFLSREAVENTLSQLDPEDFYRPAHQSIFEAMSQLYSRNEAIDAITVAARLEADGELERIGGKSYLIDVTNVVPTAANAKHYLAIIKRASMLRKLIDASTEIVRECYETSEDIEVVTELAEQVIYEVTQQRIKGTFHSINELLDSGFKIIEGLYDKQEHVTGVATGFKDLDDILAGMHAGDLIILAARPSVGKTAFALNLAVNVGLKGVPVALFSLEMAAEQLIQRVMCSEAGIDSQRLRTGFVSDSDWPRLMQAMSRLSTAPIHVDDTPSISLLEIKSKARRLFHGQNKGLIIVDYLQLMQPARRRSENRQVEIAEISRGLKIMSKELGVPVLALSQLSRAVEQRADKRPMLSDLRESGAIEQDADVVMFIHRNTSTRQDDSDDGQGLGKGEAEIIVAKHRNGPTGSCMLAFQEHWTKFVSMARQP